MPEGKLAAQYTLLDSIVAQVDERGVMVKDGQVTPDGFAVNRLPSRPSR